ncbi:MAG: hypothetical protein IPP19_06105 [Verrucomicrobia bacterium]|nr:hypothetical protein [Verrucomicrobiota bacterium]
MRYSAILVLLAALSLGGCINFTTPKPIAGEVEESFKTRWIAKRMSELQATGATADPREARAMALDEFRKKYEYTGVAKKPDPVAGSTP